MALPRRRCSQRAVTMRAVVLGLALIPLNAYWVILAELRWYMILTLNPLFVTPVIILLALVVGNAVLRAVRPDKALSVGELLVIYVMVAVSCTVATHDFAINLVTMTSWPAWYATPENKWEEILFPYLPKWAAVWDRAALRGFMEGGTSLYSMDMLGPWLVPLGIWVGFMVVLFWTMLCLNALVRKAWIEDTKLSFPVVRLPLALVGLDTPRFFRSTLTWLGMAFPVINGTLSGLAMVYPALPYLHTRARFPAFPNPPWNMLGAPYSFYPFAIGLGYFVPLDVLFSCWFFYLFIKAQIVLGWYLGLTRLAGFPYQTEQGMGAWATYGLLLIYVTRHRWAAVLSSLRRPDRLEDEEELLPLRLAFWGAAGGLAALVVFWKLVGMSLIPAVVAVGLYFLLALCITRVRAEAGSQHTVWDLEPMNVFGLLGSRAISKGNIIGAGLSHWFWRLNRSHAMPTQLEGLKLGHEAGIPPRDWLWPLLLATVASSLAGPWACLHVGYSEGAATKCIGFARWAGYESYGWMQHMLTVGRQVEWPRIIAVAASSCLILILWGLQSRYTWLWLHPLGYCAGNNLIWVWCPFLIAWAVKYAIVRYGGQKTYRRLIPFFLGLVLGDYITGAAWVVVSQLCKFPGYQIFH